MREPIVTARASSGEARTAPRPAKAEKKSLVRRMTPDRSQRIRHVVEAGFVVLNAWIGVQFLLWVHSFENVGTSASIERPAGVDGWLPIAGMMNLRFLLATREFPKIHPSALVLFCIFLLASVLVKKSFCSWLCPVGTLSEALWKLGRRMTGRNIVLPRWLDGILRGLKYLLLAFFVFIVFTMSTVELGAFVASPFGIIADVKMLNFFREIGIVGAGVLVILAVLSVFIQNFWCRFLCPYGALMGIASVLSPVKIRRDAEACIDCGKCSKVCPSHLPVDRLVQVRSVECTGCMECIAACPAQDALQLALMARRNEPVPQARWARRALKPEMVAAVLAVLFVGTIAVARATGHWQTNIPREVYMQLVPNASQYDH